MRVRFVTLGCKVNTYESEAVWELLEKDGYERCDRGKADVYIVNTCMVTRTAEQKSRQQIRHLNRENNEAAIVVMGCLSALKEDEIATTHGVVITIGTKDRNKIPGLLKDYFQDKKKYRAPKEDLQPLAYDNLSLSKFQSHQRAFLKIEDGCDNFCSYCIIPYTRGRVHSKPREVVLEEASLLARTHSEIVLTGIHTGGYGKDLNGYNFNDLLRDLDRIPGLKRVRISSIEISELTMEVIETIKNSKKIVPHLHVPLQSGSDKILKLMNRHYDKEAYLAKINELKANLPNLALTTDVIVGFPGETETDFSETLKLIETIGFNELHVFPYSKRTMTAAALFSGEIQGPIKKERAKRLIDLGTKLAKEKIKEKEGQFLNVIAEQKKDGFLDGHSEEYIHVRFQGSDTLIGTVVKVKLIKEDYPLSYGEIA